MFPPPGIPAEMAQRSSHSGSSDMGEWSGVAPLLLMLLWLWMLETSEPKSPAADHATEKARCPVFSPHRCNSPVLEVRKKFIF